MESSGPQTNRTTLPAPNVIRLTPTSTVPDQQNLLPASSGPFSTVPIPALGGGFPSSKSTENRISSLGATLYVTDAASRFSGFPPGVSIRAFSTVLISGARGGADLAALITA